MLCIFYIISVRKPIGGGSLHAFSKGENNENPAIIRSSIDTDIKSSRRDIETGNKAEEDWQLGSGGSRRRFGDVQFVIRQVSCCGALKIAVTALNSHCYFNYNNS